MLRGEMRCLVRVEVCTVSVGVLEVLGKVLVVLGNVSDGLLAVGDMFSSSSHDRPIPSTRRKYQERMVR